MAMNYWKNQIISEEDSVTALENSRNRFVLVYKHSSRCSISMFAKYELEKVLESMSQNTSFAWIDVVAHRPASLKMAEITKVKHESPQLLLLKDGVCVWHVSHGEIRSETIRKSLHQQLQEVNLA